MLLLGVCCSLLVPPQFEVAAAAAAVAAARAAAAAGSARRRGGVGLCREVCLRVGPVEGERDAVVDPRSVLCSRRKRKFFE